MLHDEESATKEAKQKKQVGWSYSTVAKKRAKNLAGKRKLKFTRK